MTAPISIVQGCLRCGTCCRRQPCPPFELGSPELEDHPDLLHEILTYIDGPNFNDDDPCLWLTAEGCKHYELRPDICREYEARSETCAHPIAESMPLMNVESGE